MFGYKISNFELRTSNRVLRTLLLWRLFPTEGETETPVSGCLHCTVTMTSSNSPKPEKKITKNTEISKTQKKKTKNAETPKTEKKKTKNAETPKTEKKKNAEIPKIEKKKTKSAEIPLTDGKTKRDREIAKEENKKKTKKPKLSNGTSKQRDEGSKKGVAEGKGEEGKMNVFPMNRIRTMIKGEDPDMRVSQEALLAINNAVVGFQFLASSPLFLCLYPSSFSLVSD